MAENINSITKGQTEELLNIIYNAEDPGKVISYLISAAADLQQKDAQAQSA